MGFAQELCTNVRDRADLGSVEIVLLHNSPLLPVARITDPRNVEHKLCDSRASADRTLACHGCNECLLPSQAVAIGLLVIAITIARHTSNGG
ncbi:hypothetical protein BN1723_011024 [Verticillium longisporum]|uniref:Uncharacterized protein n=1 Tax=Verticillium longisporum TaxID=100787 RepID=A0A0G4L3F3_VERLO|nr:hypothetical protein BN1723_011024 [Verticillium longisporum]